MAGDKVPVKRNTVLEWRPRKLSFSEMEKVVETGESLGQ
jgi:hypothetical protein